jgi:hypothetical protein
MSTICSITLCLFFVPLLGTQGLAQANTSQAQNSPAWHAMGSSPCAWWVPTNDDGQGSLSLDSRIHELRSDGFECQVFVIEANPVNTYGNLKNVLEATRDTNIVTWAVVVPPAEKGAKTPPYRTNYVAWSQALAKLSLKYKNFRGFNIDDFIDPGINEKTFTRDYNCKIYAATKEVNPHFLFMPTIYDLDRGVADRLAGCVDGVWLWFTNLESTGGLKSILEDSRYAVDGRFPVYGGVYASSSSWHKEGNPKPTVFQRSLEDSCKYSNGAIAWQLSLDPTNPLLAVTKKFLPGGSSIYAGKCGMGSMAGSH